MFYHNKDLIILCQCAISDVLFPIFYKKCNVHAYEECVMSYQMTEDTD